MHQLVMLRLVQHVWNLAFVVIHCEHYKDKLQDLRNVSCSCFGTIDATSANNSLHIWLQDGAADDWQRPAGAAGAVQRVCTL
jgi:hypothetical protein